jgi:hypothetical protein
MGAFVKDTATADVLHQLRHRFRHDGPLQEMVATQKDLGVFSEKHSLKQIFRALHLVPADIAERADWFKYLDLLKRFRSDKEGVNGHDRIREAYKENLESRSPLPVHWSTHLAADDKRVTVTRGRPIPHENRDYLVVSVPTEPRTEDGAPRKKAAARKARAKE